MKTGHEGIGGLRQLANQPWSHGDYLANLGTDRQVFVALAGYLTAVTANALFGVLKKIIFAHYWISVLYVVYS
jgi:hypothetical protein